MEDRDLIKEATAAIVDNNENHCGDDECDIIEESTINHSHEVISLIDKILKTKDLEGPKINTGINGDVSITWNKGFETHLSLTVFENSLIIISRNHETDSFDDIIYEKRIQPQGKENE